MFQTQQFQFVLIKRLARIGPLLDVRPDTVTATVLTIGVGLSDLDLELARGLAVGLALVVRIREAYGTIEDDALNAADYSLETGSAE